MPESPTDASSITAKFDLDGPSIDTLQAKPITTEGPIAAADVVSVKTISHHGNDTEERIHLNQYFRILYKRRWIAVTAFTVVLGSVTLYTFLATPLFDGKTLIQIENQEQKVVQFQQVLDENRTTNDYYQTQYRILQSRLLARRTLDAEKLWNHQLFQPRQAETISANPLSWIVGLKTSIQRLFDDDGWADPRGPQETAHESVVIDRFLRGLTISPLRNSRLVEVRYRSPDAALSAQVANAISRQYIEQNLEARFLASKEATQFLSARMKEQRGALEQSEQALQKYREQTGAVSLEDRQNIVVQRLADLNAAVTKARTERIEKEAIYNQVRDAQSNRPLLDTVPAILTNTFIQQLKSQLAELQRQQAQLAEKLGDRHPEMAKIRTAIEATQERINTEIQRIVQALRNDYQAAVSNERALQTSLEQQRGEAQELNRLAIQYGVLSRDTATNRQMFDALMQRSKETDVAGDLKTSNIRIVDAAEFPRKPASPLIKTNLLLGLLGGLFLGVALALTTEYLDNRIKTPEEIKSFLRLPYLGMVPVIEAPANPNGLLINQMVPTKFGEAFRSIRTNVLFSTTEPGAKRLVVTSTAPGEGKTLVSANLALSLASAGQRVLLVDADMRRPKIHELFRTRLEPGLSNLLVGDAKASDAVKRVPTPGFWVLPAGKHPPNPAELLGSKRFREFTASLSNHFDWIIFDSPPVMAVTDASVLAHESTGVVFVVGAEMTSQAAAKTALEQLDAAKAKYVGAILNKVNLVRHSYYYSHYYAKSYEAYYSQAENKPT